MTHDSKKKIRVLAIVGPTAVGKTEVAVCAAERLSGEIISADSRQVYRGMDIGTAKPGPEHLGRVQHHLLDVVDPPERFSAAQFARRARMVMLTIHEAGKVPVVAGGSGLYLRALLEGLFLAPPASAGIRDHFTRIASALGTRELHTRLNAVDPVSADRIHPNDSVRLVRALEIFTLTGNPISRLQSRVADEEPTIEPIVIGLKRDREDLYRRIDHRVDQMLEAGLLDEVRVLVDKYPPDAPGLESLGYTEMTSHLRGELSLEAAAELMKRNSRRFAKRQITWFSKDPDIEWIELTPESTAEEIARDIALRFSGEVA